MQHNSHTAHHHGHVDARLRTGSVHLPPVRPTRGVPQQQDGIPTSSRGMVSSPPSRHTIVSSRPTNFSPQQNFSPHSGRGVPSQLPHHQSPSFPSQPPPPQSSDTAVYDQLLELYYKNPVDIKDVVSLDLFRTKSALPNTVFEEADLFNSFDKVVSLLDAEEQEDNDVPLRDAVKRLFIQYARENDNFSPLISFHLLLYKRMKIVEKVQEFQSLKGFDVKRLKNTYEHLPLELIPSVQKEENVKLLSNLQKAMQKSDVKKGIFAKLRKTRSESVYKLLSKHASPLVMIGTDVSEVQNYLLEFSMSKDNNIKRKSKAIISLFLLALSKGSLLDVLMVLQSILALSSESDDPLPADESDEGGISLRPETLRSLLQYQQTINDMVNDKKQTVKQDTALSPRSIISDPSYSITSALRKPASIRRLFVFILSHVDLLAEGYLNGPSLLFRGAKCVNINFCVEPTPHVLAIMKQMIDRLYKFKPREQNHPRLYCITAIFRLMRLNIETLSLWKQENESFGNGVGRLKSTTTANNTSTNFLSDLKTYCMSILESTRIPTPNNNQDSISPRQQSRNSSQKNAVAEFEMSQSPTEDFVFVDRKSISNDTSATSSATQKEENRQENLDPDVQIINEQVSLIICAGFTLFYTTHVEQRQFFIDAMKSIDNSLKRQLFHKVLHRMVHDNTLFESFMVQGVGTKETSVDFFDNILSLLKEHTLYQLKMVGSPQSNNSFDVQVAMICKDLKTLTLMWQNALLRGISGFQVKFRSSTLPTVPLNSGPGKALIDYATKILNSSCEILSEAFSVVGEDLTKLSALEHILRYSIVGFLLFPLLHSFVKFLWRCGNSEEDMNQLPKITGFLYPYTVELLRSLNAFSSLSQQKDSVFDWYIAETDHPYEFKLNQKLEATFNREDVMSVAIKFDPRCRTSSTNDNLRLSSNPQGTTPVLQFAGVGSVTIPVNPLMTWGKSILMSFMSDDQQSDWGMRCAVLPILELGWMNELQKNIGWLGGRCATYTLSSLPCTSDEAAHSSWLNSRLFCNGLESNDNELITGAVDTNVTAKSNKDIFLSDLIYNRDRASTLIAFMDHHLRFEHVMLRDNEDLNTSERALIAAMLKHTDLVGCAIRFTTLIERNNSVNNIQVPSRLTVIWINARKLRSWMVQKKQSQHLQYSSIKGNIIQKAEFLLSLRSATFTHVPTVDTDLLLPVSKGNIGDHLESPRQSHSNKQRQSKGKEKESIQSVGSRDDSARAFHQMRSVLVTWRAVKKWRAKTSAAPTDDDITNINEVSALVTSFIQSDANPTKLRHLMTVRTERAMNRAKAFRMYTDLLTCTQYSSVKAEVIQGAKGILRSRSMKKSDMIDFHYFNNIEGCGPVYYEILTDAFLKFLRALMSEMEPTESDVVLSGMLREIMETCFISFKPSDVEWILELNLLQKLCPLMYNSESKTESEESVKFTLRNASTEEKKEMNKRAWKLFRMLSVRCVEMLEEWDTKEKYYSQSMKRDKIRNQLHILRDNIFGLLFDELERMIRDQSSLSQLVLEEMLSLMVSLCNTESAQLCLTTSRFQSLLLPLLKLGYPKVQELSLLLCSHLILGQKSAGEDAPNDNGVTLVGVLFEFLGLFELHRVMGIDPFSNIENSQAIGLSMAKQIFILLRKLFSEESPEYWRSMIKAIMEKSLHNSFDLLMEIEENLADNPTLSDDMLAKEHSETFRHVSAAFTLLLGFTYVPEEGEEIVVNMNGKLLDARIIRVEENRHTFKVQLLDDAAVHKNHRVPAENIQVKTQEPLGMDVVSVTETILISLINFIEGCGKLILRDRKSTSKINDKYHLLFSNLWMRSVKVLDLWLQDSRFMNILLESGKLTSILEFAEKATRIMYGKELKLDACSFAFTGKQFTRQYYYSCLTCGMSNTRAVCAVCAKTCHRGHRLGTPEIGEFYCDCGAGEGKFSCRSLKKAPGDPLDTLDRMESMVLRLQKLMPLFNVIKGSKSGSFMLSPSRSVSPVQDEIPGPTCFKPMSTRTGYRVDNSGFEAIYDFSSANLFSMLSTDSPIPSHWPGFYFEIEIVSFGTPIGAIAIGLAEDVKVNKHWPDVLDTGLTFHPNNGHTFLGTKLLKNGYGPACIRSDVIGCGWSKEHKSVFFTRNGSNIGTAFHVPNDSKSYYPIVILRGEKACVRLNLGQKPFQFNVARTYKSISIIPKISSSADNEPSSPVAQDLQQKTLKDLMALGYPENACEQAFNLFPTDLNAVSSYLHRSKSKPIREVLAEQLQTMGFDRELCLKALKISQDDLNQALNWLVSDNHRVEIDIGDEVHDRGTAFLGADCSKEELTSLITKGLLLNPDAKVNENIYSDIQNYNVCIDDLLVVSPYNSDEKKGTNTLFDRMQSNIGVVTRKLLNGAYLQTIDPNSGAILTSFIKTQSLLTPPVELRSVSIGDVGMESLDYYKSIGTLYCRRILKSVFMQSESLNLNTTLASVTNLYKCIKVLLIDQYHEGHGHNFTANSVTFPDHLQPLVNKLKKTKVVAQDDKGFNTESLVYDYVLPEAIKEVEQYSRGNPHFRTVVFKTEMINQRIPLRFWGVSSLCIAFGEKCELGSQTDTLTFYFDAQGRKQALQYKGPLTLPRKVVICADKIWYEFNTTTLREGVGFQFDVTPASYRLQEQAAIQQPNTAISAFIMRSVTMSSWINTDIKHVFDLGLRYIMTPFAPFKGAMCDAISNLSHASSKLLSASERPSLNLFKHFRVELEDLYCQYQKYHEKEATPLPVFHSMIDFISSVRRLLTHDLCVNSFPSDKQKIHMYTFQEDTSFGKQVKACTSCTMSAKFHTMPKYHSQDQCPCGSGHAKNLEWKDPLIPHKFTSIVPIERLNINPSDWFEHVAWVDQVAIVRELCECFATDKPIPDWVLFEAALEKKKKVSYRESPHPYTVINDSGEICIPGAKTIFISFDKHSKTHKCEKLLFSSRYKGGDDLGAFGGDELKDKTLIIHGNRVYYTFKSIGDDHECTCNNCGCRITGVRFHCTECDDFDLCERCIRKSRLHNETHLFLKIRRPVDCVPAALPHLYTNRWINTAQFRGNAHVGVKCNGCGMNPIRGVRFWCENCEDYNLCEKCAEEEYKYHDRMHVFLRCVRPLPPKSQMPPNALPYGLVYEKEIDTHWGYLFSVSSSDSFTKFDDPKIQKVMKEIKDYMREWDSKMDAQLVDYVESYCNGWQSLEWQGLTPKSNQLTQYPLLSKPSQKSIRYRFIVLKLLNRKLSRVLHMLNLDTADPEDNANGLSTLIATLRQRIFKSVKLDVWQHTLTKSVIEINPISLKLNRHKASEPVDEKAVYARNAMFSQAYRQIQAMNPKVLSRKGGGWKVTFLGESADDYGGPFRESLNQICTELETNQLDLLIPVPNQRNSIGENREKFMPNPQAITSKHLKWYTFMGELLGIGLLSKNVLPLDLPSMFWKAVVKEKVNIKDLEAIDQAIYQSMKSLRDIEEEGITDQETFGTIIYHTFSTKGSDDMEVELFKGGRKEAVTFETRHKYANMVEEYRLREVEEQIKAIRRGLYSIVTPRFFPIFSWHELEMISCGSPDIDLKILKKHTIYEGYTANSREVKDFWTVMEGFDSKERSNYLKFVWGRSRLPITEEGFTHHMKIQRLDRPNPDAVLPLSHTCFFSIELPAYSNQTVMRNKLLYAITHCNAIDTDFTTVATEARNVNVLHATL